MAKKLKSLLIVIVALGLAYWFIRGIDWALVGGYWKQAKIGWLLLGVVLINTTMFLRAIRWQWLLKPITSVGFWDALAATVIGFGFFIFVFGRAGDVARPLLLSLRSRVQASATIATILIERIYDVSAVAILFAVNLLLIDLPENKLFSMHQLRVLGWLMLLGIGIGLTGLVILRWKAPVVIEGLGKLLRWLPQKLYSFVLGLVAHLADGLSVLLNVQALLITVTYTAIIWAVITGAYWAVITGFNLSISPQEAIFVLGAGLVGSLIPTPGGSAGAFHVAAQKGLIGLGVEQNLAASIAIAVHFISFGSPFLWALFYLFRTDLSYKQIRAMISGDLTEGRVPEPRAVNKTAGI